MADFSSGEHLMTVYVAVVAVFNLGLGYGLGLYMERSARRAAAASEPHDSLHL